MAPDTAWELWMLPGGDAPPRSLGLITTHETQYVELPAEVVRLLNGAAGMAMSVEPRGGSPTGKPTGPVLYSGRCVQI
jgi:anti-sigma-K factor RskA